MQNKYKGEVTLDNGMKLVLDMNALVELEELLGIGAYQAMNESVKVKNARAIFYVAAKRHQPDITLEEAGDLFANYQTELANVMVSAWYGVDAEKALETAKSTKEGNAGEKK